MSAPTVPDTAPYGRLTAIACALADGVLSLSLCRPQKQNALNIAMVDELVQVLGRIADDRRVRVVLLRAQGPHFCAGMDLHDFFSEGSHPAEEVARARRQVERLRCHELRALPQPVLALVQGNCLGAAIALLEASDIVLASDTAAFGFPEINFGFFFGGAIAKAALAVMPRRAAVYYGMLGDTFGADEAQRLGLVTRCVAGADLDAAGERLARRLADKDAAALALSKENLHAVGDMPWNVAGQFAAGKAAQLNTLQRGPSSRAERVQRFVQGEFKPGRKED